MVKSCEVVKLDLQLHEESAVFSVDATKTFYSERNKENACSSEELILATGGGDGAVRIWRYSYVGEKPAGKFRYSTASEVRMEIEHLSTLRKHKGSDDFSLRHP